MTHPSFYRFFAVERTEKIKENIMKTNRHFVDIDNNLTGCSNFKLKLPISKSLKFKV